MLIKHLHISLCLALFLSFSLSLLLSLSLVFCASSTLLLSLSLSPFLFIVHFTLCKPQACALLILISRFIVHSPFNILSLLFFIILKHKHNMYAITHCKKDCN
ncbi:hypothetical protein GQ42DRAFT_23961 [Ramicandelaber brevisporus]|nr:hypothetical protein GQ42DRAFT_23961 [Ramicandelaber brevisporus]